MNHNAEIALTAAGDLATAGLVIWAGVEVVKRVQNSLQKKKPTIDPSSNPELNALKEGNKSRFAGLSQRVKGLKSADGPT